MKKILLNVLLCLFLLYNNHVPTDLSLPFSPYMLLNTVLFSWHIFCKLKYEYLIPNS